MNKHYYAALVLDNISTSIVFVDRDHVIRYANATGKAHYAHFGNIVGKSLWDCHNEASKKAIIDYVSRLEAGEDEILYLETPEKRVYIRSARAEDGALVGYYETVEPPLNA